MKLMTACTFGKEFFLGGGRGGGTVSDEVVVSDSIISTKF
jgi:hypothetical protein